jgi:CMP-N-acetylneuraminic acid synthetase
MRPKSLARDDSLIGQALKYSLERLIKEEGYRPECLVELYPTHPFRTPALLDHLTGKLLEGYDEVFTVRPVDFDPERFAVQKAEGGLTGLVGLDPSIGGTYRRYGQFSGRRLLRTECYRGYAHVIENPVELVDIDYLEDFLLAEQIILRNMYDFGAS